MSTRIGAREAVRPRVLMATPQYFPSVGGVETHVHEVSSRLVEIGHNVTVLAADTTGELPQEEDLNGVLIRRVRAWPRGRDYLFAPAIQGVVNSGVWDVVHVQSYHTLVAPTVMFSARRAHIPYVLTFHGGGHSAPFRRRIRGAQLKSLRPLLADASNLVVLTQFEVEMYGRALRLDPSRFVKIPNGCDLPAPAVGTATSHEGTLVLSVGRLERYKGHQHAIAALPHFQRMVPDARLRIVGTGPYEESLRAYAEKLGVRDSVEIRGVPPEDREAMATLLASADLFVLMSEFETHPVAVLEALAVGRPVVVADSSGLSELAARGVARAVPLGSDPRTVADAMLGELQNPHPAELGQLPTWDDCAAQLSELYASTTGGVACAS